MQQPIRILTLAGALLWAGMQAAHGAAAPAGTVVYAYGQVDAAGADGSRALKRGDPVYSGDVLQTQNGRTQVRFTDGGFAALQPNTQYRIDDYSYAGAGDTSSRSFFNLVKGGVRFVSGAIGRIDTKNYRIQTAVATIGIRGSAGRVWTDGQRMEAVCHRDGLYAEQNGRRTNFDAGQGVSCTGTLCNLVETGSTAESGDTVTQEVTGEPTQQYTQGDEFLAVGSGGGASTLVGPVIGAGNEPYVSGGQAFIDFGTFPDPGHEQFIVLNAEGAPVGGVEVGENGVHIVTNDLDAILDLAPGVTGKDLEQFVNLVDAAAIDLFRSNPAELVEFGQMGDFVWAGFANGYVLRIDGFASPNHPLQAYAEANLMQGHQASRVFYGPPGNDPGTVFKGLYAQFAEFHASNASGTATGTVSNGIFEYVFGLNQGTLGFDVALDNGRDYFVEATVAADANRGFPFLVGSGGVFGDPGSPACHPSCSGAVNGNFIGADAVVTGRTMPEFAGFSFFIFEENGQNQPDPVGGIVGLKGSDSAPYSPPP